ncbi:helix-turn-helix transcriptional regulator [Verminephrobacter aporrectodeae]|uniref:XRE family transcriptional regulator n=1 Tax=Verminephrobacter aporrectodeae subsp. tuberculatae TaxID=1110392 RepID=A0ABT3KZM6_9BURK|nr:helix-turn-helix transcriptional regulator [Verminephrobacter aporrectodeae]MCW5323452.1 XRE family transcriptional regulator [Verminephrobacter aporrectodeae subsp. tuberculatae]MCW8176182.1 XRE family transcriptional regulator [Verminephrobacter aporrectodeae subsp. tuberculatae]MCW8200083.1 XRE family transcriptional regulator [Verminephrobacter aporrectodeae subsp. tuberculatae]MCW8203810.1 XRE family transcriptional regulator [Verminephrobacter aporrectodeae subsp. tuberculatae]MCW8208
MDRILRAQDSRTFGRMLRDERKALGKSQDDVAAAVGTRRQTIADLEHGKNVGSHTVFAVLAAIGKMVAITDARPDLEMIRAMLEESGNG